MVAAADLRLRSRRLVAHRVQHVVPMGPRQVGGIGLRPLDVCRGVSDFWIGCEPGELDLESIYSKRRASGRDLRLRAL